MTTDQNNTPKKPRWEVVVDGGAEPHYSVETLAKILDCKKNKIYVLMDAGELEWVVLPGMTDRRVRASALAAYQARAKKGGQA